LKKENLEKENRILKEKLDLSEKLVMIQLVKSNKKYKKLEESIDSMAKLVDKKVLGNTNVETIRTQSRKKYKDFSKDMNCVHCKHSGSTQVCHIKAISDYNKLSSIDEINHISNLIGLCPNCHIDLDKHKKFEVTRTATLHSMLIKTHL
jgi:5-methylcytosine-specific restriction endonuclease McrA